MISRRAFLLSAGALVCLPGARPARAALPPISMAQHETAMRIAIEQARRDPAYPFGAVIVRPDSGEIVARGVNDSSANPILHGEIACMNDYVRLHGNSGWSQCVLYTTGEPCSMCMSALVWAGIGGTVFASTIDAIRRSGIDQINLGAQAVIDAAPFYKGLLLGGVLSAETDKMFAERKR
ncbi:MAG: nucleoside deaminase [Reyranellaceae bacterium]